MSGQLQKLKRKNKSLYILLVWKTLLRKFLVSSSKSFKMCFRIGTATPLKIALLTFGRLPQKGRF